MKVGVIVQARMTSTRLPGKVLLKVMDKPLLEYQIERLRRVTQAHELIIATTVNETDQPIVDWCRNHNVNYSRGSETDVLARYYNAAQTFGLDVVVRVTGDCPLIDPAVVDRAIKLYVDHVSEYDYVTNGQKRTYPRGMDVEVFPMRILTEAYFEAKAEPEREHVTPFIYGHLERYRIKHMLYIQDKSEHRWTVDTQEDFELIAKMLKALYPVKPQFAMEDMLDLLAQHPEWSQINAHIEQKKLGE